MPVSRPQPVPLYLLGRKLKKLQISRPGRNRPIGGRTTLHLQLLVDEFPQADELVLEKQGLRKLDRFFISYDFINNFERVVEDEPDRQLIGYEKISPERLAIGIERPPVLEDEVLIGVLGQKKTQVALTSFRRLIPYDAQERFQLGVDRFDKL